MISKEDVVREVLKKDAQNQFITVLFDKIDDLNFRNENRGELTAYMYLRRHVVRKAKLNNFNKSIHNKYYKNGLLVVSMSISKLTKDFGLKPNNRKTVTRWIAAMEQRGWFRITNIDVGCSKPQNVYILGTYVINNDGCETENYYFDNTSIK